MMLLSEGLVEVLIKVIAYNEEGQSNQVGEADLLKESNTAVNEPDWRCYEVIDLPAEMNHPARCSSNRVNLARLVILTGSSRKFELLLNSHCGNNLLSHASSGQVIVPVVAGHEHHDNIEAHKKCDQSNRIIEICIFLVLHKSNNFIHNHWISHMNASIAKYSKTRPHEPILERDHYSKEYVLLLL